MPAIPFLPAFLRRRPTTVDVWPRNPKTVADDLRESLTHEGELAEQLRLTRQELDLQCARATAFERRAEEAHAAHQDTAAKLIVARADLQAMRKQRDAVQRQLDSALGYDKAALDAIESGTGQPRKGATA